MARRRAQRAGRLIQEEISKIIQEELKDPRIGFVTVTGVDVTDDLRCARVFITVLKEENKKKTLKALKHARGFIRREIGHRIKSKFTPEIEFRFDESIERGTHVEEVLRKITGNTNQRELKNKDAINKHEQTRITEDTNPRE